MSSPIQPPQGPAQVAAPIATQGADGVAATSPSQPIGNEASVSVQTIPSTPPPELLDEIGSAAATYSALQAQGLTVRYSYDAQTRRTSAQLQDAQGQVVRTLTPSEAVALAAGEAPELSA